MNFNQLTLREKTGVVLALAGVISQAQWCVVLFAYHKQTRKRPEAPRRGRQRDPNAFGQAEEPSRQIASP
jgi:hypothetical protein